MTTPVAGTTPQPDRDLLPDLVRAFALIGIVLVNVEMFSSSLLSGYGAEGLSKPLDHWSYMAVSALFTLKSYSLFSLMFGAGFGYQIASARQTGKPVAERYFRRMSGLLLIGFLHAILLFAGDILVTYAILGTLLYFCRNAAPSSLIKWGTGLICLQMLLLLTGAVGMSLMTPEALNIRMTTLEGTFRAFDLAFSSGNFLEVTKVRLSVLPRMLPDIMSVQGISAFGFFLIGLALFNAGLIRDPGHYIWELSRTVFLPVGLLISVTGAFIYTSAPERQTATALTGLAIMMLGSPFASFGYIGWITKLCHKQPGRVVTFLARGGSASLSVYLLQSVILGFIYLDYGLGLFAELSASSNILIALISGVASLSLISIWKLYFFHGPAEMVLRAWTRPGAG